MKQDKHLHKYDFNTAENTGCGDTSVWVFGSCECGKRIRAEATLGFDPIKQEIDGEEI